MTTTVTAAAHHAPKKQQHKRRDWDAATNEPLHIPNCYSR